VPATPSSSIPAALTHLTHADPRQLRGADAPHLLAYLAAVPDPRAARCRRHRLVAILALAAAAVLAGARSIAAIAEWAADAPQPIRAALGAHRDAPATSPFRPRPPSARPFPAWAPTRWPARSAPGWPTGTGLSFLPEPAGGGPWPSTARRYAAPTHPTGTAARVHLLAAMDHANRAVLTQRARRRRARRGPRVRPTAGAPGPGRRGGHRRRAADPPPGRRVPGHQQAGALPAGGQGQPARAAGLLRGHPLAQRSRGRPHPRPRPRPHRAAHPQGGLGAGIRVPARRPGHPGHPHDPSAAPTGGGP
jgi:DDE_Tnp_1-associated